LPSAFFKPACKIKNSFTPMFHPKQLEVNDLAIGLRPKREGNLVAFNTLVNDFFELLRK